MKTRSKRKARRKTPRRDPQKRRRPSRSQTAKALDLTLKHLRRAVGVTISKADSVLAATEAIANLAATRTKFQLLRSLLDDNILTALYGLPQNEDTSRALRMHSRWLREHFDVESIYEQGEELEVPKERLAAFDLIEGTREGKGGVCSIRIIAVGWKQGTKVLRKPVASVTEGDTSRLTT